jgi:hypothetical protein
MPAGSIGSLTISQDITISGLSVFGGNLALESGTFSVGTGDQARPISVGADSVFEPRGVMFRSGAQVMGPGLVRITGASRFFAGSIYDVGATEFIASSGVVNIETSLRTGSLVLGGTASGPLLNFSSGSSLTVTGPMTWNNGRFNGPVIVGGHLTMAPNTTELEVELGAHLQLNGGGSWSQGAIFMNGSTISNNSSSQFVITGDNTVFNLGLNPVPSTINNAGVIRKQSSTGSTVFTNGVSIVNTGSIEVLSGELICNQTAAGAGGITNTGSITVGSGATLSGTIRSNAQGVVQGTGTLGSSTGSHNFAFATGSTLSPGTNGPGVLNALAVLTFEPGALVAMNLNGNLPGTEYDQVNLGISGSMSLNAAILTPFLGFEPVLGPGGDTLTILSGTGASPQIVGQFLNSGNGDVISLGFFNGVHYGARITYNPNSVVLDNFQVLPIPEPTSLALCGLAAIAGFRVVRRRLTPPAFSAAVCPAPDRDR